MDVVKDQNKIMYLFYEYNPLTKQKDKQIGEIIVEKNKHVAKLIKFNFQKSKFSYDNWLQVKMNLINKKFKKVVVDFKENMDNMGSMVKSYKYIDFKTDYKNYPTIIHYNNKTEELHRYMSMVLTL